MHTGGGYQCPAVGGVLYRASDCDFIRSSFFTGNNMRNRKAFTMVELMVVVMIVGILAAVAVPMMTGRVDAAKWSEGKAAMGTIASALRAYAAEKGRLRERAGSHGYRTVQQRPGRHVLLAPVVCHHLGLRHRRADLFRDHLHGRQLHPYRQAGRAGGCDAYVQCREQLRGHLRRRQRHLSCFTRSATES